MSEKKTNREEESPDVEVQFSGVYRFKKPVEFEGQAYTEVKYDLEALTSADIITAKKEAARLRGSETAATMLTDETLHAVVFARSADLPASVIPALSASDFAAWSMIGQLFFVQALGGAIL